MGVWIETIVEGELSWTDKVTPCVGVWIETLGYNLRYWPWKVTPCVGVWIETEELAALVM